MSQRDTGQFVTLQSWRSKFKNGSHWPKITMSAGMQTILVLGEDSLGGLFPAARIRCALPSSHCSVASFPFPLSLSFLLTPSTPGQSQMIPQSPCLLTRNSNSFCSLIPFWPACKSQGLGDRLLSGHYCACHSSNLFRF